MSVSGIPSWRRARVRLFATLLAVTVSTVSLLAPATPASAHAILVRASPPRDAVVDTLPRDLVLTFNEPVRPVPGRVRIIAPDNTRADRGDPTTDGNTVRVALRAGAPRGTFLVTYRVISADSHPVGGSYTFSLGAPSAGAVPVDAGASQESNPAVVAAYPVVRWLGFAGLILLTGAVLVLSVLWPQRLDPRGPGRFIAIGATAIAFATVSEVLLQIPYVAGGSLADVRSSDVQEALASRFGAAHLLRLGALVAVLILTRPLVRGRGPGSGSGPGSGPGSRSGSRSGSGRVPLAVVGVIGVATWSLSGHPGASVVPLLTGTADVIHLSAMSVWLGGLVMLIVFLLPQASAAELRAITPVWSRWAVYAVSALVLTGVAQALIEVSTVHALFTTAYGWLITTKVGLVCAILGVAHLSRRTVPAVELERDGASRRLRRLVIIETAAAVVVLGLASILVQVTPARTAAEAATGASYQNTTLRTDLYTVELDLEPAITGSNDLHLYAFTPQGGPADIKEWTVKASLPAQEVEPISVSVLALSPDHAVGAVVIPTTGEWTFSITLRTTDIDQATVTTVVEIQR